jgi:hypothetical protein
LIIWVVDKNLLYGGGISQMDERKHEVKVWQITKPQLLFPSLLVGGWGREGASHYPETPELD